MARAWLVRLFPVLLFLLALLPRLVAIGRYVTPDELVWVYRALQFREALLDGRWADTLVAGHPGVTTTWLGAISMSLQMWFSADARAAYDWLTHVAALTPDNVEAFRRLAVLLTGGRVAVAVVNSLGVVGMYLLVRRIGARGQGPGAREEKRNAERRGEKTRRDAEEETEASSSASLRASQRSSASLSSSPGPFLIALLLALDPFLAGLSGLFHVDGLSATLATLALLALAAALGRGGSRFQVPGSREEERNAEKRGEKTLRNAEEETTISSSAFLSAPPRFSASLSSSPAPFLLALSGVLTGLAVLTKTPTLVLLPVGGLALLWAAWRDREHQDLRGLLRPLRSCLISGLIWAAAIALTIVALYPALWSDPAAVLATVGGSANRHLDEALRETFFLGRVVFDPGPLFYPVALLWRLSPVVWLAILPALALRPQRSQKTSEVWRTGRFPIALLLLWAVLFIAAITPAAKKFDRYILPVVPALLIVAGTAWSNYELRIRNYELGSAGTQGRRGAGGQGRMGAGEQGSAAAGDSSSPPLPRSPAPPRIVESASSNVGSVARRGGASEDAHSAGDEVAAGEWRVAGGDQRPTTNDLPHAESASSDADRAARRASEDAHSALATCHAPPATRHRLARFLLPTIIAMQALFWLAHVAYPLAAYNPLVGGGRTAARVLPAGWGESIGAAGRWLAETQADAADRAAIAGIAPALAPFFPGRVLVDGLDDSATADYQIATLGGRQLDPAGAAELGAGLELIHTVRFGGLEQAWVYRRADPQPATEPPPLAEPVVFGERLALVALDQTAGDGTVRLAARWQRLSPLATDEHFTLRLAVSDDAGNVWSSLELDLLNEVAFHPPDWAADDTGVVRYALELPPAMPPGRYAVQFSLVDGRTAGQLPARLGAQPAGVVFAAGAVDVPRPEGIVSASRVQIPVASGARWADGALWLLGHSELPDAALAGGDLALDLFWHFPSGTLPAGVQLTWSLRPLDGGADVTLITAPLSRFDTGQWRVGETVQEKYRLPIPPPTAAGRYALRLQPLDAAGRPLGPAETLGELTVDNIPRLYDVPMDVARPLLDDCFGATICLRGAMMPTWAATPGQTVELILYWQALEEPAAVYTAFLHVLNEAGETVLAADHWPGGLPSDIWDAGQVIEDRVPLALPADLPPGVYRIRLGLYTADDGRRLPLDGSDADNLILPWTLNVVAP